MIVNGKQRMRNLVFCLLVVILLTACAATERTTSGATATIAYTEEESQTVDLRLRITDGQQPVQGTIWLYWPDTGGDLAIGPTSDIVLPIPADGAVISVTVTAHRDSLPGRGVDTHVIGKCKSSGVATTSACRSPFSIISR